MKKKISHLLLAVMLLACLTVSLLVPAAADDGDDSMRCDLIAMQNSYSEFFINGRSGHGVKYPLEVVYGSYPPGMQFYADSEGRLFLDGTPTQAGYWTCTLAVDAFDYEDESTVWGEAYVVNVTVESVGQPPFVTKHPTGETVAESGWTEFIAYANDAKFIRWELVNQANGEIINALDAPTRFPGVKVTGADSSTIFFENVPLSMNNWAAQCVFTNDYGSITSSMAPITVIKTQLKPAVINSEPVGGTVPYGGKITLTVSAVSPDNNQLTYQWYKNDQPSRNGGNAIYGAYGPSFTADYEFGTHYYYCVIHNTKGAEEANPVSTALVTVQGEAAPTATPAPTAAPTATPTPAPSASAAPTAAPTQAPAASHSSNTLTIVFGIIALALAAALAAVLITSKKKH